MADQQSTGELLTNGHFATGDFAGWSVTHPEDIFLARQEGTHVAVIMPVPYDARVLLRQEVVRERASGSYIFSFWLRTSDKRGDAFPDITRKTSIHLWLHPHDGGDGLWVILDPVAVPFWSKSVYRFSLKDRGRMRFEIYFNNENGRPDALRSPPIGREGYQQLDVIDESPDLVLPADFDVGDCPYAVRDVSLFKAA
ncbi:hypothetical protein PAN31117_03898 [Pandoraea anapnoica]|uniref:Uncharacterized protein n=1 Tax=Pandoraea anapnoica TaxID=2508301 RepID=A0A5E5ABP6_9BURK|nr:hypothetical protein [Pandoraea anapnoica]VVE71024.1 hypothetical protein PAN31117_03898 [Pandoraea anapnoica]